MSLQALVLCSDEKILRVLRRVLGDLEIHVEHCPDRDAAIHKLTRQRFEAVIVDCQDETVASQILRSARTAPCNKRAIAVALIDGEKAVRSAFDLGAHFVLYKPISMERAKTSFRAARALMKRERRRNQRVSVEVPVTLLTDDGSRQQVLTSDLGEGGLAVHAVKWPRHTGPLQVQLTLPGSHNSIECAGEVAWEGSGRQSGIRFLEMPVEARKYLKQWLNQYSSEIEKDDPPALGAVAGVSPEACYVELLSPFPVNTKVLLSTQALDAAIQVEGVVRVMHPEKGIAIEFLRGTEAQRTLLEGFLQTLSQSHAENPEVLVEPEGLESAEEPAARDRSSSDPLLNLFWNRADLSVDVFLAEARKQGTLRQKKAATFAI
ncbi:MAG: PilZ domain-containing protein [Acidobacteria bacterium]|nr:PilZ domain-containing protein [Acidobacteriota bacterium]